MTRTIVEVWKIRNGLTLICFESSSGFCDDSNVPSESTAYKEFLDYKSGSKSVQKAVTWISDRNQRLIQVAN
jgi:hypothetical protein